MSEELEGKRVPDVKFRLLTGDRLEEVTSEQLFAHKSVALFALPGAFTPTCSNRQVPRFNELAPALRAEGIDAVLCLSVNDPFVMAAWARDQHAENITFLPDSEGEFTRALGMTVDKRDAGLGVRSRRYSMLVRDGVIDKAFVEPDQPGDPFTVSDTDTLLRYLNPHAQALQPVTMFARQGCPFCQRAERLLSEHAVSFECIYLGEAVTMQSVLAVTGAATVPQVFIAGKHIGGTDALEEYFERRPRGA